MKTFYIGILLMILFQAGEITAQFHGPIYTNPILIKNNCASSQISSATTIQIEEGERFDLYNFNSNLPHYAISHNKRIITKKDTIQLSAASPVKIELDVCVPSEMKDYYLSFQYIDDTLKTVQIPIKFGYIEINSKNIEKSELVIIDSQNFCSDSISIVFPYGGTISGVNVFNGNDIDKVNILKSASYEWGGSSNILNFPLHKKNEYSIEFYACHWGGNFSLLIE